jgi:molecular chaperone DnaK (HSP70)
MNDLVVGIDLGTTNSEVAAYVNGRVQVLGPGENRILPSCVGISPSGELLVGEAARNQLVAFPDRTVRSIKRKMGSSETVDLAGKMFTPQEISALILRELAEWARRDLRQPVERAVITVPAYFSDAQRTATREAGTMAGLQVARILNEPTAASLAYGFGDGSRRTVMVYDLGGGTFDVSIVTMEGDVTEVLASHGNNHLGGDDFDDLLAAHLERQFKERHDISLGDEHRAAIARLWWAAEAAKKKLSFEPFARIREEALLTVDGKPLHLDVEVSRAAYEQMILPLVESTLDSVSKALNDANKRPGDVDAILLVGGSTRTPLVSRLLRERVGLDPMQEVHPDLCVALGAGVLASRLSGHDVERVLVDVSPYSFGPSYLGERGGVPYPYCYSPIIRRNSPLPLTRMESYYTSYPRQTQVDLKIFQGDDDDALKNTLVGEFRIEQLTPTVEPNEVLCRMSLDLDGILHVTATEKRTGKSKHVTIANALRARTDAELAQAQARLQELYSSRAAGLDDLDFGDLEPAANEIIEVEADTGPAQHVNGKVVAIDSGAAAGNGVLVPGDEDWAATRHQAVDLIQRSESLLERMHADDREEATELHNRIRAAVVAHDPRALGEAVRSLKELLFFVEGG